MQTEEKSNWQDINKQYTNQDESLIAIIDEAKLNLHVHIMASVLIVKELTAVQKVLKVEIYWIDDGILFRVFFLLLRYFTDSCLSI